MLLLLDDTNAPQQNVTRLASSRWQASHRELYFNNDECKAASSRHDRVYLHCHTHVAMFHDYLRDVDYDFLWMFEYDALCWGDWSRCLAPASALHDDFLGYPSLGRQDRSPIPDWMWWDQ